MLADGADVTFVVGTGEFARQLRGRRNLDIRWGPSTFDPTRFGRLQPQDQPDDSSLSAVIANRNRPKLSFRGLPGWKDRIAAVEHMQAEMRSDLALYGRGWNGPSARGPIPYDGQGAALGRAWTSFNWDHFPNEPSYFSDRLPIALASGSVFFTTDHPEYDRIFPLDARFIVRLADWREAPGLIRQYVERTSVAEHVVNRYAAWAFAHAHFRQDDDLVRMLNFDLVEIEPSTAKRIWDLDSDPLLEY